MSEIEKIGSAEVAFRSLREAIALTETPEEANEARARIESAKAWARAHNLLRDYRLELLTLEIEALVRVADLDGLDLLSSADAHSAQFLAAMTAEARAAMIADAGSCTTAGGLVRRVMLDADERARREAGRNWKPPAPSDSVDPSLIHRQRARAVREVMADLLDEYVETGKPFTVDEFTDGLIAECVDDDATGAEEQPFLEGVREMIRGALRRDPQHAIDGVKIPRVITARTPGGAYVRIPTTSATLAHLYDSLSMRDEQLDQDRAARDRFAEFVRLVEKRPEASNGATVGEIIAAEIVSGAA